MRSREEDMPDTVVKLYGHAVSCWNLAPRPVRTPHPVTKQTCARAGQAISDYRAELDGTRSPDKLANDDQWIVDSDSDTPVLVPSNGYTFERSPWQV